MKKNLSDLNEMTDSMFYVYIVILKFVLIIFSLHCFIYHYFAYRTSWIHNLHCYIEYCNHLGKQSSSYYNKTIFSINSSPYPKLFSYYFASILSFLLFSNLIVRNNKPRCLNDSKIIMQTNITK